MPKHSGDYKMSLAERKLKYANDIRIGLTRLMRNGISTEKNSALVVNHPEFAKEVALVIWYLHLANKEFVNDHNRNLIDQFMSEFLDCPNAVDELINKFKEQPLDTIHESLKQDHIELLFESFLNPQRKMAFLQGLVTRLGQENVENGKVIKPESAIHKFFGSTINANGAKINNNELTDIRLIGEIFSFLQRKP